MTTSILFVCLGNICRSPLAEGIFRHLADEAGQGHRVSVDSAGTGGWHAGEPPDPRSVAAAARYGIDISAQRARQITTSDFTRFDLILGLDRSNVDAITRLKPPQSPARVALYLQESLGEVRDVPDPYYGAARDFDSVFRLCHKAGAALLGRL